MSVGSSSSSSSRGGRAAHTALGRAPDGADPSGDHPSDIPPFSKGARGPSDTPCAGGGTEGTRLDGTRRGLKGCLPHSHLHCAPPGEGFGVSATPACCLCCLGLVAVTDLMAPLDPEAGQSLLPSGRRTWREAIIALCHPRSSCANAFEQDPGPSTGTELPRATASPRAGTSLELGWPAGDQLPSSSVCIW